MARDEEIRLKRPGGVGSPGQDIPEHWYSDWKEASPQNEKEDPSEEEAEKPRKEVRFRESDSIENVKIIPGSFRVDRVYNLNLTIHTVSGQKFYAKMNYRDLVNSGKMTDNEAKKMLEQVENDIKYRTFRRPVTYTEKAGELESAEFIFNPRNIVAISLVRHF